MNYPGTRIRSWITIGIGLAAAGAIALPSLPHTPDLRLASAARSVAAPAEGAYWHTKTLMKSIFPRYLGHGKNLYWVEQQKLLETWISPDGKTWAGFRELGARPKSTADEEAWRRDGSPSSWKETADGSTLPRHFSIEPGKGSVGPVKYGVGFHLAGRSPSYEQIQALPADPAKLKALMERAAQDAKVPDDVRDGYVAEVMISLLHTVPAPKEVRAAAYRTLPTMSGVRALGKVKDSQGRTGEGFSIDLQEKGKFAVTKLVIVDTATMQLLAEDMKTTIDGKVFPNKTSTSTLLQVGWTNDEPSVPALP
ncbi:hypothetical protein [Streptosporangium sp. NPDC000396]|uniref:hypothetical protein n=1 Tax=Streptosporangium sp. NPDC000396 TaxID=3366185 RepID=UPI003683F4EE